MTQRQLKVRRRRADWVAIVERYKASGLDRGSFAAQEGVNPGTLSWWALQLRGETGKKEGMASPKSVPPRSASFIPVRVVASASAQLPSSPVAVVGVRADQTGGCVEVVVSQGTVLRLDPERLSERGVVLVAALAKELCR